jgi:CRP-like cAMP-binding protein
MVNALCSNPLLHSNQIGESMYVVDEGMGGTLEVRLGDKVVHHLKGGDSFGESSLLFQRPRSTTVVCSSAECHLHEMKSSDFYDMLEGSRGYSKSAERNVQNSNVPKSYEVLFD